MLKAVDRQANPNYNDRHRKYQDSFPIIAASVKALLVDVISEMRIISSGQRSGCGNPIATTVTGGEDTWTYNTCFSYRTSETALTTR